MFPASIESQIENARQEISFDAAAHEGLVAWYEREFSIPADWCVLADCLTQLTFGACGYETRVWLNDSPLVTIEGEEAHLGEYNSFSYELPPELLKENNRLTIHVFDPVDSDIPRGEQASRVYKQGGIWYQQAASIEEKNTGIIDPSTGEMLVPPGILDSGSSA